MSKASDSIVAGSAGDGLRKARHTWTEQVALQGAAGLMLVHESNGFGKRLTVLHSLYTDKPFMNMSSMLHSVGGGAV